MLVEVRFGLAKVENVGEGTPPEVGFFFQSATHDQKVVVSCSGAPGGLKTVFVYQIDPREPPLLSSQSYRSRIFKTQFRKFCIELQYYCNFVHHDETQDTGPCSYNVARLPHGGAVPERGRENPNGDS